MQEKIAEIRKLKLLFIEDEEELLKIICDALKKLGINYLTATNGKEGLEVLANNSDIDVIITDINMPIMNGLEMIKELNKQGSKIPVVVMSAHTEEEYIDEAKVQGISEYLLKPFDFIKFIDIMSNLKIR